MGFIWRISGFGNCAVELKETKVYIKVEKSLAEEYVLVNKRQAIIWLTVTRGTQAFYCWVQRCRCFPRSLLLKDAVRGSSSFLQLLGFAHGLRLAITDPHITSSYVTENRKELRRWGQSDGTCLVYLLFVLISGGKKMISQKGLPYSTAPTHPMLSCLPELDRFATSSQKGGQEH